MCDIFFFFLWSKTQLFQKINFLCKVFSLLTINYSILLGQLWLWIYHSSIYSDESEDGLDDSNPLLPQSGDPLIQVKEEPPNSLLGETSGASNSGMLNTYSLNGVLQSGQCGMKSVFGLLILWGSHPFIFFLLYVSLHRIEIWQREFI